MFNLFEQLKTTVKALKALIDYKFNILDKRIFNILHDEESEMITTEFSELTWDGNTEGLASVSTHGNVLCLIYDNPPTFEEASTGGRMIVSILQNGEIVDEVFEYTTENVVMGNDNLYMIGNFCVVVLDNNVEFQGFVFPKKGIYFISVNIPSEFVMYVKSLSINNYIFSSTEKVVTTPLKKIDKKYIPGGVADWNVNDSTASGYIENRPFYDAVIETKRVSGDTLTWDMDIDGLETDNYQWFYRISATPISEEILSNGGSVVFDNNADYTETFDTYNWKSGDVIYFCDYYFVSVLSDGATDDEGITYPKAGIYINKNLLDGPSAISVTFNSYNSGFEVFNCLVPSKKIDEKFLPDSAVTMQDLDTFYNDISGNFMSRSYPSGTGSFSMNRNGSEGSYSTTTGRYCTASGKYSRAGGYYAKATNTAAIADGYYTEASGMYSHASGRYTSAASSDQSVRGKYNAIDSSNTYADIVGNGTSTSARKNAYTLDWNGNAEFAGDVKIKACGGSSPISLAEVAEMATSGSGLHAVAKSGSWNDLVDKPFYDNTKTESIYVSSSNKPTANTLNNNLYYGTTTGSSTTIQIGSRYKLSINNINEYSSTIFVCTRAKVVGAYQYCNVLGNAQLGVDAGFLDGNNASYPIADTGENFCFLAYQNAAKNVIISTVKNTRITNFYTVTGEIIQLDEKYIPDTIARTSDVRDISLEVLTEQLVPETAKESLDTLTEISAWIQSHPDDVAAINKSIKDLEESIKTTNTPKDYLLINDVDTDDVYVLEVKSGNLVTHRHNPLISIAVTTLPSQTEYNKGEPFNSDGMVVVANYEDGTSEEITKYNLNHDENDESIAIISYEEYGVKATTSINLTIKPIEETLVDFDYTSNSDGTYTITGWKGTYNGETSTECIVPNSCLINIE